MKKAFTLAEVLVTITILGIIMAITIPVLNNTKPDKDPIYYKKGLQSIQGAMSKIMDMDLIANNVDYKTGVPLYLMGLNICPLFVDFLNTAGRNSCDSGSTSDYDSPNFVTTDGLRFWGFEQEFTEPEITVYFDRKFSKNELKNGKLTRPRDENHKVPGLVLKIRYDGKVSIPNEEKYSFENNLVSQF